ncbi:uncharacterized protein PV09_03044 [Verruconis gallopava]|uniref:Uncharacterized protein n=1 Tax=Verruconis gallopava TaxID=253628 RepID=A0A0D2AGZ4_9PEZI|nr:uncharacterized protein PV09_03044 [Verruconis gallopava]KIW05840.1 hypothetical protein PV09_03044 [Verruconis gallopava]
MPSLKTANDQDASPTNERHLFCNACGDKICDESGRIATKFVTQARDPPREPVEIVSLPRFEGRYMVKPDVSKKVRSERRLKYRKTMEALHQELDMALEFALGRKNELYGVDMMEMIKAYLKQVNMIAWEESCGMFDLHQHECHQKAERFRKKYSDESGEFADPNGGGSTAGRQVVEICKMHQHNLSLGYCSCSQAESRMQHLNTSHSQARSRPSSNPAVQDAIPPSFSGQAQRMASSARQIRQMAPPTPKRPETSSQNPQTSQNLGVPNPQLPSPAMTFNRESTPRRNSTVEISPPSRNPPEPRPVSRQAPIQENYQQQESREMRSAAQRQRMAHNMALNSKALTSDPRASRGVQPASQAHKTTPRLPPIPNFPERGTSQTKESSQSKKRAYVDLTDSSPPLTTSTPKRIRRNPPELPSASPNPAVHTNSLASQPPMASSMLTSQTTQTASFNTLFGPSGSQFHMPDPVIFDPISPTLAQNPTDLFFPGDIPLSVETTDGEIVPIRGFVFTPEGKVKRLANGAVGEYDDFIKAFDAKRAREGLTTHRTQW